MPDYKAQSPRSPVPTLAAEASALVENFTSPTNRPGPSTTWGAPPPAPASRLSQSSQRPYRIRQVVVLIVQASYDQVRSLNAEGLKYYHEGGKMISHYSWNPPDWVWQTYPGAPNAPWTLLIIKKAAFSEPLPYCMIIPHPFVSIWN